MNIQERIDNYINPILNENKFDKKVIKQILTDVENSFYNKREIMDLRLKLRSFVDEEGALEVEKAVDESKKKHLEEIRKKLQNIK